MIKIMDFDFIRVSETQLLTLLVWKHNQYFQIVNEGDFQFFCRVTYGQKVDFLISNIR